MEKYFQKKFKDFETNIYSNVKARASTTELIK